QSLLPWHRCTAPPGQHREAIIEMRGKAPDTEHVDLCRRQLDSQRHAIEPSAYLERNRDISVGEVETVEHRHRWFVKQLDRRKAHRFGGCETIPLRRNLERWQAQ